MKLKRLLSKKQLKKVDTVSSYNEWSLGLKKAQEKSITAHREFVFQQWAKIFGGELPKKDLHLLELKIGYHLQYEEKKAKGETLSPKSLQNYKAAMEMNVQKFHPEFRSILDILLKSKNQKENTMKAKKKAVKKESAVKISKGPKKGETWAALLTENFKKKLNDTQLAAEMTKRMNDGTVYTEAQVLKSRGFFNFGALSSKIEKPKTKLVQFGSVKKPLPKKKVVKKKKVIKKKKK